MSKEKEVEDFVDQVLYPVAHKYELDVQYAERNKESFTMEEITSFLRLSLMRSIEELAAALVEAGVPKGPIAEIVKGFAADGQNLPKRVGLPEVKLESFAMVFAVAKPAESKEGTGRDGR